MSEQYPPPDQSGEPPQNVATAIAEVSERATLLIREEIELAKAELNEKTTKLIKGTIVGVAAGVFFVMALVFALFGFAYLLYYCGLKPREIVRLLPDEFSNVYEIYRTYRNIDERLKRNTNRLRWRLNDQEE